MCGAVEDRRIAIGFSVTLSGQLVQAAVTLLTVQGAYVAYALASRETMIGFEMTACLAVGAFIWSIYCSGKAITAARDAGFDGNWDRAAGKSQFNMQAILLVAGVVLLAAMILLSGTSKESDATRKLAVLTSANATLEAKVEVLAQRIDDDGKANGFLLSSLKSNIDALRESARAPSGPPAGKQVRKRSGGAQ